MDTRQCRGAVRGRAPLLLVVAVTLLTVMSLLHRDQEQFDVEVANEGAGASRTLFEVLGIKQEPALPTKTLQSLVVTPSTVHNISEINRVLEIQTGHCDRLAELGGTWYCQGFDGNKDVCFDPWFQPPSFNSCIAYSFGVGHDISFEFALVDVWACRIYMHDYTVNKTRHEFDARHIFKQQGIANRSYVDSKGNEFVSFRDSLAANGHLGKQIHYLKIDIEGAEHEILPDMITSGLLNNVWQLHMEVHSFGKQDKTEWLRDMQRSYAIIRQLEDSGFRRVRTTVNNVVKHAEMNTGVPGCCSDVLWVNTKRIPADGRQDRRGIQDVATWTENIKKF